MMMQRLALGAVLAVALVGAAGATDLPVRAPYYKAPPVPVFSWTGCYVGGNVGGLRNDSKLTTYPDASTGLPADLQTEDYGFDQSRFTGGVQYGCNRQFGSWVVGLDSSFSWAGLNESASATYNIQTAPGVTVTTTNDTVTQKLDWYSTTRGRIGWAQDRWMIFAAGGLASGRVESSYLGAQTGLTTYSGSQAKYRFGWTVGGGVEYALSDNWFLRGEYLYVDLGKYSYTSPNSAGTLLWTTDVDTRFQVARLALSYRFTRAGSLLEWAMGGFRD